MMKINMSGRASDMRTRGVRSKLKRFGCDRRGNIAILTAIMAVPVIGLAGLAVDHTIAASAQSDLDNAADSAALGAINRAAAVMKQAGRDKKAAADSGVKAGLDQFLGNAGKVPFTTVTQPQISVDVEGLKITSTVRWTGQTKTSFGGLFGVKQISLSGVSQATQALPAYTKVIVLLDNSSSMGIGVTEAEQKKAHDATGCAIGCHVPVPSYLSNGKTPYTRAREAGAVMRIDFVRDALKDMVERSKAVSNKPNQFKFGLYTFSSRPKTILSVDDSRSGDADAVQAALDKIALTEEGGSTNFKQALKFAESIVASTSKGDGSAPSKPIVYVMFVTDGIEDFGYYDANLNPALDPNYYRVEPTTRGYNDQGVPTFWGLQTLDDSLCSGIKSLGATLLSLQVTYVTPHGEYADNDPRFLFIEYNLLKSGVVDQRFKSCASKPEYAFKGKEPSEISSALDDMFRVAVPELARLAK